MRIRNAFSNMEGGTGKVVELQRLFCGFKSAFYVFSLHFSLQIPAFCLKVEIFGGRSDGRHFTVPQDSFHSSEGSGRIQPNERTRKSVAFMEASFEKKY